MSNNTTVIRRVVRKKVETFQIDWSKPMNQPNGRNLFDVAKHLEMLGESRYNNTQDCSQNMCGCSCNAVFLVRGPDCSEKDGGECVEMSWSLENYEGDVEGLLFESDFFMFEEDIDDFTPVSVDELRKLATKLGFKSIANSKRSAEVNLWAADMSVAMMIMILKVFFRGDSRQDDLGVDFPIDNFEQIYRKFGVDEVDDEDEEEEEEEEEDYFEEEEEGEEEEKENTDKESGARRQRDE